MGISLFADDGIIWKKGRNKEFIKATLQEALNNLESWALAWGFRFSSSKKSCGLSNKKSNLHINVKLYEDIIEKYKLRWKMYADK